MKTKNFISILICGLFSTTAFSQVGVNTARPQGAFHIDGAKDNSLTGAPTTIQSANDVIITNNGAVGIGTVTPNSNAMLDISSSNKGVKLPTVALLATNNPSPLSAHVAGMIIYNSATAGVSPNDVTPGLYTNDGSKWIRLITTAIESPVGSVFYRASSAVPTGYLECNGAEVSRTTYATLFAVIGTTFGTGNGSTTFNLPDLRGEFIRGWDNTKGTDSSRTFGSWQKGSFIAGGANPNADSVTPFDTSTSTMPTVTSNLGWDLLSNTLRDSNYSTVRANNYAVTTTSVFAPSDSANDYAAGIARPRNVALMPIIKY